jgi:hypothetical protein
MRKASAKIRDLAQRLLQIRARGEERDSENLAVTLAWSCEVLCPRLADLVGREGFRALLSRALALAKREPPLLDGVHVGETGSLIGLDAALAGRERAEVEAVCIAVLGEFLGLLTGLIGVEITRQLVTGAWPDALITHADFGIEDEEE